MKTALATPAVTVAATPSPQSVILPLGGVGSGPINPTSLSNSDVSALQMDSAGGELEFLISNIAAQVSTRSEVVAYANQINMDHQNSNTQGQLLDIAKNVAGGSGVTVSTQATGLARQVLAAVGSSRFDATYLAAMAAINTADITIEQNLASTTSDADVRTYANAEIPENMVHLQGAQSLMTGTTFPVYNAGTTPVTTPAVTASAADAAYLQTEASGGTLELISSEIAALVDPNINTALYAQQVVNDHSNSNLLLTEVASSRGVTLPTTLNSTDAATAKALFATLNTSGLDKQYLSTQIMTNTMDIATSMSEASSTTDPNIKQIASTGVQEDNLHLIGAQYLSGGTSTTTLPTGTITITHRGNRGLSVFARTISGPYVFRQHYTISTFYRGRAAAGTSTITQAQATTAFLQNLLSQVEGGSIPYGSRITRS